MAATGNGNSNAAKLIPIGAGFFAGAGALLNNSDKAKAYTRAAGKIDSALSSVLGDTPSSFFDYQAKTVRLEAAITDAKNELEEKRTEGIPTEQRIGELEQKVKSLETGERH